MTSPKEILKIDATCNTDKFDRGVYLHRICQKARKN